MNRRWSAEWLSGECSARGSKGGELAPRPRQITRERNNTFALTLAMAVSSSCLVSGGFFAVFGVLVGIVMVMGVVGVLVWVGGGVAVVSGRVGMEVSWTA